MRKVVPLSASSFSQSHAPVCWWPCFVLLRLPAVTPSVTICIQIICPRKISHSEDKWNLKPTRKILEWSKSDNHCRSNPSSVGLACHTDTLRPRSWANIKVPSGARCKCKTWKVRVCHYFLLTRVCSCRGGNAFPPLVNHKAALLPVYCVLVCFNEVEFLQLFSYHSTFFRCHCSEVFCDSLFASIIRAHNIKHSHSLKTHFLWLSICLGT